MDPIQLAVNRVKHVIPRDILSQAFMPRRWDAGSHGRYFDNVSATSIDHQIKLQVVDGRVAIDVNLVGGTEMFLPLAMAELDMVDGWNMIYRFGREATGGRRIVMVHELNYGYTQGVYGGAGVSPVGSNNLLSISRDIIRGNQGGSVVGTAYVQLVGINTVLVNDVNQMIGNAILRCTLTHEPNFNDIKPVYYQRFAQLVELAAKAHIYNILVVDLDEGQIRAGATLGRIREISDQYADANQMYYEYLETTWAKTAILNDVEKYRKVLKLSMGAKPRW